MKPLFRVVQREFLILLDASTFVEEIVKDVPRISRVKTPAGLKILCLENDEDYKVWTKNVVYREIFSKLP